MKKTLLTALSIASLTLFTACNNDASDTVLTIDGENVITKDSLYEEAKNNQQLQLVQGSISQALYTDLPLRASKDLDISKEEIDAGFEEWKKANQIESDEKLLELLKDGPENLKTLDDVKDRFVIPNLALKHLQAEGLDLSDEVLEKEFNENKEEYERVAARHILVEDEETAKKVVDELNDGKSFEEAVQEYSIDEAAKQENGNLGEFNRSQMVPEFSDAAFDLEVGKISEPVKSDHGFHIIEVTERLDTFEANRDAIETKFIEENGKPIQTVIKELIEKYKVKLHDDDLKEFLDQMTTVPEEATPPADDAEESKEDTEKKDEEKKDEKKDEDKKDE
ncbi:foldase protein PrsA [Shouchella lonarensis]|uniref:peptidylprolyl isomerase n=1 Tax=Shouchella lonarensis TaxID=1464122 RepID=A0A1G6JUU5_9BACI|nr:peptidylprolyl isomerase [Shouchella lonarensis]SDC22522.1 peptidylprolyl isomerase/foldase protein PrsA [Shouchella lonarensis]